MFPEKSKLKCCAGFWLLKVRTLSDVKRLDTVDYERQVKTPLTMRALD